MVQTFSTHYLIDYAESVEQSVHRYTNCVLIVSVVSTWCAWDITFLLNKVDKQTNALSFTCDTDFVLPAIQI